MQNNDNRCTLVIPVIILGLLLGFFPTNEVAEAEPEWNVEISGSQKGIDGFHVSVGDHYKTPATEVVVIRERGIADEELPVVYFLSQRARVAPGVIVDMRLKGMSWMDITVHFGFGPEMYYVPVTVIEDHQPRGHAYGYYKKHKKKKDWKKIHLKDADIINQVNLRFLSEHYHCPPEQVIRYRSEGRNFRMIDHDFKTSEHHPPKDQSGKPDDHGNAPGKKNKEKHAAKESKHGKK
ncbi:MAG: hypothetical protein ACOZF0_23915 [Thermodesulfobacteriota bacterium]